MSLKLHQVLARPSIRGFLLKESYLTSADGLKLNTKPAVRIASPSVGHVDLTLSLAALRISNIIQSPPHMDPGRARIPPPLPLSRVIQLPQIRENVAYEDKAPTKIVDDPINNAVQEKRAARLIVIRKKKMRKHKLLKLRKRMKFEWAKIRQKREMQKEKLFQAGLLAKIKEAESFDPAKYAAEKIARANEVELPKVWYGVHYPDFIMKQLIEDKERKEKEKEADEKRRAKMSPWVKDYLKDLPK